MLTEREVREQAGDAVDTDEFPRPVTSMDLLAGSGWIQT